MGDWVSEIIVAIISLLIGAGIGIKITKSRTSTDATSTTQENNIVGGDQAGRDIRK